MEAGLIPRQRIDTARANAREPGLAMAGLPPIDVEVGRSLVGSKRSGEALQIVCAQTWEHR
jgi:hypothetical protein